MTDSSDSPREALAREGAEAYAEFSAWADDPQVPERARQAARRLADILATQTAYIARLDLNMAEQERVTTDLEAILYGEDMSAVAASLRRRLSGEQRASLLARLDSDT